VAQMPGGLGSLEAWSPCRPGGLVDWRPGGLGGLEAWRHWSPGNLEAYGILGSSSGKLEQVSGSLFKRFVLFVCFKKIQVKSDQRKINLTGTSLRNIY
jgi:hypothetical protein